MVRLNRVSRNWQVIIVAMVLLMVALGMSRCWNVLTTAEAIDIFLVAGLVLITTVYAKESEKSRTAMETQAREMHEATVSTFQPIVVLGRHPVSEGPSHRNTVVKQVLMERFTYLHNVGPGPALNLCLSVREPNRKSPSDVVDGEQLRALGPGEAYELDLQKAFGEIRRSSHDLVVEYEDIFGLKWRSGLVLSYDPKTYQFTIIGLFYEKVSELVITSISLTQDSRP